MMRPAAQTRDHQSSYRLRSGLVVTRTPRHRRIVEDMLAMADMRRVEHVPDAEAVILKLQYERQAGFVLCEADESTRHHLAIAKFVRWNKASPSIHLPIVALGDRWTLPLVKEARDAGVTEIIGTPIAIYAFMRRFVSALYQERRFIMAPLYRGPDRRKHPDITYKGPWRRSDDSPQAINRG